MRLRAGPRAWRAAVLPPLLFACLADAGDTPVKPWAGPNPPPFRLDDLQGRELSLSSLKGKVVLVNFWATWCEPCREEMPSLEKLRKRMEQRPFEVLTINYGEARVRAADFATKLGLTIPVLLDPEKKTADAWKVRGLPMTFLVDAQGKVRYWTFGERDWNDGQSVELVERLLAEPRHARR